MQDYDAYLEQMREESFREAMLTEEELEEPTEEEPSLAETLRLSEREVLDTDVRPVGFNHGRR